MNWCRFGSISAGEKDKPQKDQRKEPRIGGQFEVLCSGSDKYKIVMGHARIVNLNRHGFGLHDGRHLKPGIELARFFLGCRIQVKHGVSLRHMFCGSMANDLE